MKIKMTYDGEVYDDSDEFKMLVHAPDMYLALCDGIQEIRSRIKHGDNVSDEEERFLESLRETLYVEGVGL